MNQLPIVELIKQAPKEKRKFIVADQHEVICEKCEKPKTYVGDELIIDCHCQFIPEIKAQKQRQQQRKLNYIFNQSLVNPDIKNASFESSDKLDDPVIRTAYMEGYNYADNFDPKASGNLLLVGSTGTGKSFLSYSIGRKVKEKGHTVLFIDVVELLGKFKETYNKNSQNTEAEIMQLISEVDLLILDDVGANKQTDWANERIYDITNKRQGKCTVYTTNLSADDMQQEPDIMLKRSYSRMVNKTKIIKMYGKDRRFNF